MTRRLYSIVALGAVLFCLAARGSAAPDSAQRGFKHYFPTGTVSSLQQAWFGSDLAAMYEPVLSPNGKPPGYFALRILFLPTFSQPVAIRYEVVGAHGTYRAVMLSGLGGYDPGEIKTTRESKLTSSEICNIRQSLVNSGYWSLPDKDGVMGLDGTELVVETVADGKYRVFVRWQPSHETDGRGLRGIVSFVRSQLEATGFPEYKGLTIQSSGRASRAADFGR